MKKLLLLLTLSLSVTQFKAQNVGLFEGTWIGQGYQINNNETWSILLSIVGENIVIDYPSLSCSARLTKVKMDKNKLFLTEKLTLANTCIDNGKIELEWLSPNEIRFKWSYSSGIPGSIATLYKFN